MIVAVAIMAFGLGHTIGICQQWAYNDAYGFFQQWNGYKKHAAQLSFMPSIRRNYCNAQYAQRIVSAGLLMNIKVTACVSFWDMMSAAGECDVGPESTWRQGASESNKYDAWHSQYLDTTHTLHTWYTTLLLNLLYMNCCLPICAWLLPSELEFHVQQKSPGCHSTGCT